MAEELNTPGVPEELEAQADAVAQAAEQAVEQMAEQAAEAVAPQADDGITVAEEVVRGAHAAPESPTELIETPEQDAAEPEMTTSPLAGQTVELEPPAAAQTVQLDPPTEAIPAPVERTTPMPNPIPEPSSTMEIPQPTAPAVTTEGYDVPVNEAIPVVPADPTVPRDPYAPATMAAATVAAPAAAAQAAATQAQAPTQPPTQPVEPWRQQATGYSQTPTYADPNYRPNAYQEAVSHQPFAPDPVVAAPYDYPLTQLSGGMKFGWLVVGFLLGIPGMVIAWLVNVDKHPQVKKDAVLWSVIGFAISVVLALIFTVAFAGIIAAAITQGGYYYGYNF